MIPALSCLQALLTYSLSFVAIILASSAPFWLKKMEPPLPPTALSILRWGPFTFWALLPHSNSFSFRKPSYYAKQLAKYSRAEWEDGKEQQGIRNPNEKRTYEWEGGFNPIFRPKSKLFSVRTLREKLWNIKRSRRKWLGLGIGCLEVSHAAYPSLNRRTNEQTSTAGAGAHMYPGPITPPLHCAEK